MKETKKIYVVGSQTGYACWLEDMGMKLKKNLNEADIALFTGGADINPALYGEKKGSRTYCFEARDEYEVAYYNKCKALGIPMLGICRGGQLFCAMEGAALIQHSSHPYDHKVTTKDGEEYWINSMHHQQFLLDPTILGKEIDCEIIAWAENISHTHLDENDVEYDLPENYREPEVCFFPESKALAIQCHPECIDNKRTMKWFEGLVRTYLLQEKEELQIAA